MSVRTLVGHAASTLALSAAWSCSLAGIADGTASAGGGEPGPAASSSSASTTSTTTSASSASVTSTAASASTGDGGAGLGGGDATSGTGGAATSPIFTWAEARGSETDESTADTDGRLVMTTLADGTVVVASVVDEAADDEGTRDRLSLAVLREQGGSWSHTFDLEISRHDGGNNTSLLLGGAAAAGDRFAIALTFKGTLELPDGAITSISQDGAVLAWTVDEVGELTDPHTVTVGGVGFQAAQSVAFVAGGDILIGGRFSDGLDCPNAGGDLQPNQGFVARFDQAGTCTHAVRFGDLGPSTGGGVRALATRGLDVLAIGLFTGTLVVGDDTLTSSGGQADGFLLGLDASDDELVLSGVAESFGGEGRDIASAAVALNDGAFVVAGETQGGDLGDLCGTANPTDRVNAFVARLTVGGTCEWLRTWETAGPASDGARALAVAPDGGVFVAGPFKTISPCATTTWTAVDTDGFVFRLDPTTGAPTHGVQIGGGSEQTATALAPTADDLGAMVGGSYNGYLDPLLPTSTSIDLFFGALRPMSDLRCPNEVR